MRKRKAVTRVTDPEIRCIALMHKALNLRALNYQHSRVDALVYIIKRWNLVVEIVRKLGGTI